MKIITRALFCFLVIFQSGCVTLSEVEIEERLKKFKFPNKNDNQFAVFVISSHGYYEPWTHFNLLVNGIERELYFGDVAHFLFDAENKIEVKYQYDELFKRKDKPIEFEWKSASFFEYTAERNMFLMIQQDKLVQVDESRAIREIVIIEGVNEQRKQRQKNGVMNMEVIDDLY